MDYYTLERNIPIDRHEGSAAADDIRIERNVRMPRGPNNTIGRWGPIRTALARMLIGESFAFDLSHHKAVNLAIQNERRRIGTRYAVRRMAAGRYRVWRTV